MWVNASVYRTPDRFLDRCVTVWDGATCESQLVPFINPPRSGPGFGPQGEGAIEGVYTDYRRDALHAHDTPSPYNRFLRCGVGSVEDAAPS